MHTFGARLRAARNAKGLTQQRLGDAIGVSKGAVSRWESDQDQPQMGLLEPLCATLMVSLDYLVRGEQAKGVRESAASYAAHLSPEMVRVMELANRLSHERLKALLVLLDG